MARFTKLMVVVASLFMLSVLAPMAMTDSVLVIADGPAGEGAAADAALLAEHRIEPTLAGVTAFLLPLRTELADTNKAEALIAQLGDERFRVREAAMQQLIEAPSLPLKALQRAT